MTDHGTQFYANKRDKNGNSDSEFENFLKRNKIVHILSPVNALKSMARLKSGMILTEISDLDSIILTIS
jgi:hypothetical protein